MATRKQLSDVLREEANKMPDAQVESESAGKTNPPAASKPTAAKTQSTTHAKKPKATSAAAAVEPAADSKAQLEDTISGLQAALNDAGMNQGVLQRKIEALEADLAEQRQLVQQLKTELEHSKQDKTELAEAKRVIVQLSELNAQLETAAKALKTAQATPQALAATKSPQATKPPAPPDPEPSSKRSVHPGHSSSQRSQIELHRMLDHPVLPAPSSTSLSNDEIGWVD